MRLGFAPCNFAGAIAAGTLAFAAGCTSGSETFTYIAISPSKPETVFVATYNDVLKSKNGGTTWVALKQGLSAARIQSLAIDPTNPAIVYAGTFADTVYKSTDGGNRWSVHNAGLKEHVVVVNNFVFNPKNPKNIFIATTVGIFETHDEGLMWEEMSNKGLDSVYIVPLVIDHSDFNVRYAGTTGGVYKSVDGGKRWTTANKGLIEADINTGMALGVNAMAQHPKDPAVLYIGTTRGAYKSTDAAGSWTTLPDQIGGKFISSVLIDSVAPETVYAGTSDGVYKSEDGGRYWILTSEGIANHNIRTMAIHPTDPNILYAGTYDGLYKTVDGARTWVRLNTKPQPRPGT